MGETVVREDSERVATLTLNRPQRLNAITPELAEDLRSALAAATDDSAIHVIRLRGAGRTFCAGDGRTAAAWGLASDAVPEDQLEDAGMALAQRVARLPINQLHMMKLLVNQTIEQMGLATTQLIGTLLDGAARHTPEGVAFTQRAMRDVRGAVAERDGPFGDYGQGPATAGP